MSVLLSKNVNLSSQNVFQMPLEQQQKIDV